MTTRPDILMEEWNRKQLEKARAEGKLCVCCGEEIGESDLEWAKKHGMTFKRCWVCRKLKKAIPSPSQQ